jgi:peptidoglycan hydrolase-like protein with peptidoglycan-binding domain
MLPTLSLDSTGDDVKRVQRVLSRMLLANPSGPITGVFDAALEAAVKLFQSSVSLPADGIVGPSTWAKLPSYREASPTVQLGSTGPVVAWLQQQLSNSNIASDQQAISPYTGAIDGIFGPLTEAAVRSFQQVSAPSVSGIVDDNTWFNRVRLGSATEATLESECGLLTGLPL